MCIRKQTVTAWGIAVVGMALLVGFWGHRGAPGVIAAQVDPAEVWEQAGDAFNSGDVDALMEFYADDAVLEVPPLCYPVECVSKDAIRNTKEYLVALNLRITTISSEVSGNTVRGSAEVESDWMRGAGVDRIVLLFSVEVRGDKISEERDTYDLTDPQTADFVAAVAADSVSIELRPGRDADQSPGTAMLAGFGSQTAVAVVITPGPVGVPQPIHIHEGTCASLGGARFPLQAVGGGRSGTVLDVPLSDLQTGDFAINVQKSQDEPDVYVACGDIPAAAAEEAPEIAPAPAVVGEAWAVAPAPGMPAAGSGGLLAEEGSGLAFWWYALAAGGALLVMVGLAGLGKAAGGRTK